MKTPPTRRAGSSGFSLIEMIVVIAIMSILVGAAIPVTEKVIAYKSRKATREELEFLSLASAEFFRDTNRLPDSIEELIVDPGDSAWAGPYISGVLTDQITGLTSYQVDAWSRAYEVEVDGDVLTITSGGEDLAIGGTDIDVQLDVTWIRREKTLEQLKLINQAVTLYNGQFLTTSPLPARWTTALDMLVNRGFLPTTSGYVKDAWGDEFIAEPEGRSPLVRVVSESVNPGSTEVSTSKDKAKKDKAKKEKAEKEKAEKEAQEKENQRQKAADPGAAGKDDKVTDEQGAAVNDDSGKDTAAKDTGAQGNSGNSDKSNSSNNGSSSSSSNKQKS